MDGVQPQLMVPLERLRFRRQFLLGPRRYAPNEHWTCISLPRGLELSVHSDLPFDVGSHGGVTVTLIGRAIDPGNPETTESEIARSLAAKASSLDSVIELTRPLAGRWAVIFQTAEGARLFTDPCGLRQVFYYSDGETGWCASQPELIRANCPLRLSEDEALIAFLTDPCHVRNESAWIGPKTIYERCFHLMPNHHLDMDGMTQTRFRPRAAIPLRDTREVVESASAILQGIMTALSDRCETTVALTAGWDSRVLLAASRHVSRRIEYHVNRRQEFPEDHPDVVVAARMGEALGLDFSVKVRRGQVPGWFVKILAENVTCARVLPKTSLIYDKLVRNETRININGNGGEICRNHFDGHGEAYPGNDLSSSELAARMFGEETVPQFVLREMDAWRDGSDLHACEQLGMLGYLYWEQRMGNWGAQFPAEQDVVVEELSPFNCRLLIETLSSAPNRLRGAPDYPLYRELIRHMWPEALEFPVNPRPKSRPAGGRPRRGPASLPYRVLRRIVRAMKA